MSSKDPIDAFGFLRPHGRIGEDAQRSALAADGVRAVYTRREDIEKVAVRGRVIKVRHLFLLADPAARRKRGGWRKDLLDFMGRVEDKGAIIKDVGLQLTTAKHSDRARMLAVALEHLANNGRTTHLALRRQGRVKRVYPPDIENAVEKIWLNRRDYPDERDAVAAITQLDAHYTRERARREYGPRIKRKP